MIKRFIKRFSDRVVKDNRGFLQFLPAAISAGAGIASLFGDDNSNLEGFTLPEFFQDPKVSESQDFLFGFGKDLLSGNVPDYFKSIGETGSPEFENIVKMVNRDITQSATETAARQGRGRSGFLPSAVSRSVADASGKLRFEDFLRATQGKQNILNTGVGVTEGVRGAGLTNQAQKNSFNLGRAGLDLNFRKALDNQDLLSGQLQGQAISDILSSVAGGVIGGKEGGIKGGIIGAVGGIESLPNFGLDKFFDTIGKTPRLDKSAEDIQTSTIGRITPDLLEEDVLKKFASSLSS